MTAQPEIKKCTKQSLTVKFVEEFMEQHELAPRPLDMVESAKPKHSPYHSLFEWNDKTAGHLYRLDQARFYLRSVKIEITTKNGESVNVRAFHSVVDAEEEKPTARYTPVQIVVSKPDQWAQVREECDRYLRSFVAKNRALLAVEGEFRSRYAKVVDAIEKLDDDGGVSQ